MKFFENISDELLSFWFSAFQASEILKTIGFWAEKVTGSGN